MMKTIKHAIALVPLMLYLAGSAMAEGAGNSAARVSRPPPSRVG